MGGSITSGIAESATTNGRRRCGCRHEGRSGGGNAWEMPARRRANRWLEQGALHIAMQPPAITNYWTSFPPVMVNVSKSSSEPYERSSLSGRKRLIRGNISGIRQKDGYIAGLCP